MVPRLVAASSPRGMNERHRASERAAMRGTFFQSDPDLRICGTDVWLDPAEPRPLAVVTHGHADHIGRHEHYIATPPTGSFLRARVGADLEGTELPFGSALARGPLTITLHPAGHILGSAMARVEREGRSLLYTGDFRLRPSLTAEPAEVVPSDAVIMEATYGSPEWSFPSREELAGRLLELVHAIRGRGRLPVLLAYSLGKAQEVAAMLAAGGEQAVLHPAAAALAEIYRRHSMDLGPWETWGPQGTLFGTRATTELRGKALIVPPHCRADLRPVAGRYETVALTGWALRWPEREKTDHALPLSDHADFGELLELVERASPRVVYVTHGSARFARELRSRGVVAEFLRHRPQMRLF